MNYAGNQSAADETVGMITAAGGTAIAVQGDVSHAADVAAMVKQVESGLGPVTILVNNAGITDAHKPWHEISEEEWDRVLAVNLKSCFLCFREVYPAPSPTGMARRICFTTFLPRQG